MKTKKNVTRVGQAFILISTLSLLSVVVMAFFNPQSVMDLVQVKLSNTDAFSSIRGIYGGAGLAISISLLYFMFKDPQKALGFLSMLWGFYALSRVLTIFREGPLGDFGKQWLVIESIFFLVALSLLIANRTKPLIKTK